MATVVCIGTLDTKGREYAFLCDRLREHDVDCVVVDAGVHDPVGLTPDITRDEVARASGGDVAALAAAGDRGAAVTAMAAGAEAVVRDLFAGGRLDGVVALGGSGGSSIAARTGTHSSPHIRSDISFRAGTGAPSRSRWMRGRCASPRPTAAASSLRPSC